MIAGHLHGPICPFVGVQVMVAELCLNHAHGRQLQVYDQNDSYYEQKPGLTKWSDFIEA